MLIEVIIATLAGAFASGPNDYDRGGGHFFCCESTGEDEYGRDMGEGCKKISESDAKRCKAEVLECPGGLTMSFGVVHCTRPID